MKCFIIIPKKNGVYSFLFETEVFFGGGVYYRVVCSFQINYNRNGGLKMKFCWIELI